MAVTDPRSRNEEILRATIDGTEYDAPPRSRIEDLLIELKEAIEQGGGGGGGDVTGVKGSAESTYRKGNVNLTAENIGVEAGAEVNTIESVTLNGDTITPDANKNVALVVITNTVNNLVNYYLKTETYSKSEVDAIAALLKNGHFIYVNELPTTDIDQTAIYLVPKSSAQTNNVKDEYINLDGTSAGWELIGDTQIDLSNYVTTSQLTTALADYTTTTALTALLADKVDKVSGKGLSTNDYTDAEKAKVAGAQPQLLDTPLVVEGVEQTTVEGALGAINNKSGTGSIDHYSQLPDKPQIANVTLEGNKSLADLGIQPAESGKGLSTNDYDNTAKGIVDGVTAALAGKVDKENGKGLSTNDYTSAEKAKLESLTRVQYDVMPTASGARVGMVVQYIGATNANYTHNYVYECVDNGGSYAWERKDVQPNEGGGHTIENASGTTLTQRDTLQFKGGLSVSDDSTNEVTVVTDTVPEIEWSVWNAMTPQEQEAIPNAIILNAPDSGGGDTSACANKTDISSIILTGTTNTSGSTITAGTWFYLNGEIVKAKVDIASNATFTKDTNYEEKTIGEELAELNSNITKNDLDWINDTVDLSIYTNASQAYTIPADGYVQLNSNTNLSGGTALLGIMGSRTTVAPMFTLIANYEYQANMLFVRAGMRVYVQTLPTGFSANYTPFS